ncbi:hypothetical protein [Nonomuraea rubra]|uniref:Tc toxin subunit A-related protein n=1 Tax=Nonomuraea rubra TaxID=46180 RepID=UPI0033DE17F3
MSGDGLTDLARIRNGEICSWPFEGHGAVGSRRIELPVDFRQFDYDTVSDVILHLRYTAGEGGAQFRDKAVERVRDLVGAAEESGLARLFSLRHDFPAGWYDFVTGLEVSVARSGVVGEPATAFGLPASSLAAVPRVPRT